MAQQHMPHRRTLLWRQVEILTKVIYLDDFILWVDAFGIDMPRCSELCARGSPEEK
ncbi:unannotated protein [freshwater metagenome]|uniref:Unannotated protein n=1 Tax=freshwater metagenome TaxID=449393 RepID=A0A6J7H5K7_9ZZZZ